MRKIYIPIVIGFSLLISFSCEKSSLTELSKTNGFDRKAMLQNYVDNLILPAFTKLQSESAKLDLAVNTLVQSPTESALLLAQKSWETTFMVWMEANSYNFGPSGEDGIRKGLVEEIGTFPVSETKIEANIVKNQTSFTDFNRDNRGLLTIEYLLFEPKESKKILLNANRLAYLKAVSNDVKTKVGVNLEEWKKYKIEFLDKSGTDVGSSTSQLYNEFVRSYESIKNFKIGLPLGVRAGQTKPEPNKVEAYYSGKSIQFLKLHLLNIENIWLGKGQADGVGFKEYLETVEGGKTLVSSTESQLSVIKKTLDTINETSPFSQQIIDNPNKINLLHTELQKNMRFFKSDMSSLLGIAITFSSGDGD